MAQDIQEMTQEEFQAEMRRQNAAPVSASGKWERMYQKASGTEVPFGDAPADPVQREDFYKKQLEFLQKQKKDKKDPSFVGDFNKSIERQGGWGLSPETRTALGEGSGNILSETLSSAADVGMRVFQGANAGVEAGANTLDRKLDETGISEALSYNGNKFHPGEAVMALMEAFPDGGLTHGFVGPKGDPLPAEVRQALNEEATARIQKGASYEEMNDWAKSKGMSAFGEDVKKVIEARDAQAPAPAASTVWYENPDAFASTDFGYTPTGTKIDQDGKATATYSVFDRKTNELISDGLIFDPDEMGFYFDKDLPNNYIDSEGPLLEGINTVFSESPGIARKEVDRIRQADVTPTKPEVNPTRGETAKGYGTSEPRAKPEAVAPAEGPDVVTRLTRALQNAGTASEEQKALYRQERAKRFEAVRNAQETGGGKKAYEESLMALSGEMPKADFESVAGQFSAEEINSLFDNISQSNLSTVSKLSAHTGLDKLLRGEIPQPKQLETLAEVFPPEFIKAALSKRSTLKKTLGTAGDLWDATKSLQATADLSGPLRQGIGLIHRGEFWKSLIPMIKSTFSSKYSTALEAAIKKHPNYDLATESGLSVTTAGKLGISEDMFNSHLVERIPGWGHVVKGSERAYVGFLNKLRFDSFNALLEEAKKLGHDVSVPGEATQGIANYVNVMTGRGGLGKLEGARDALNKTFYSPGLISSRLQILTAPVTSAAGKGFIAELPTGMRAEAAKSYAGIIGFNTAALSLAALAGKTVITDPLSSDFMKIKDGDTRVDLGAGISQYITVGARAVLRQSTSSGEKGNTRELLRQGDTPLDNDLRFVINKMHPTLTYILDQQRGKDAVGEPFEYGDAIIKRITPMGVPDIVATLKEHPNNAGMFYSVLGILGAGLSNYHSKGDGPVVGADGVEEMTRKDFKAASQEPMLEMTTEEYFNTLKQQQEGAK